MERLVNKEYAACVMGIDEAEISKVILDWGDDVLAELHELAGGDNLMMLFYAVDKIVALKVELLAYRLRSKKA